jgi:hypothetical protein
VKTTIMGQRQGPPGHLYLYERIRMGDMASLHMILGHWRQANPERRLYVYYNPYVKMNCYARYLDMAWCFNAIADEVSVRETPNEPMKCPPGEEAFNPWKTHMWERWRQYMFHRDFEPTIMPTQAVMDKADSYLAQYKVPPRFAVLQPLCDAGYHKYRNAPQAWWSLVCKELTTLGVPTVVIGPAQHMRGINVHGCYRLYEACTNPYESMGVTCRSAVHAGGETGLPLWAGIFRIPVVALFRQWRAGGGEGKYKDKTNFDYRPISFGAPVVFAQLGGEPGKVARTIHLTFEGKAVSTPVT